MSKLVIVESPAKAKTIKKYLGKGYEVIASMGHIRDLPKSQMGVDIKKNFGVFADLLDKTRKKLDRSGLSLYNITDLKSASFHHIFGGEQP